MVFYYFLLMAWCCTFPSVAKAEGITVISAESGKQKMMEIKDMMRGLALKTTSVNVSHTKLCSKKYFFLNFLLAEKLLLASAVYMAH